jgi:hypothetical protein
MSNIIITGSREQFLSKRAIERLKRDIRDDKKLEPSDYLNDGYTFEVVKKPDEYLVNIMTLTEYFTNEKRKMLRDRLKSAQNQRGGMGYKKLDSLKRSVPEKLFKTYRDVLKVGSFNVPPPDEVINNIDKYRNQISLIAGNPKPVSNDEKASIVIKRYFKSLAEFLNIQPVNMEQLQSYMTQQQATQNNEPVVDVDTEEEPELVNI